jgi:hypothetical protein
MTETSTSRARRCLEPGLSILVGTVDAQGVPSTCRAVAVSSDDDLETLTVYVPVATSHTAIQNLATTKRIAVAATHPWTNCATQIKGTVTEARLAREDESAYVRTRLEAFADGLESIGVPRRLTRSVAHWPAFAIRVRVEQMFDQTPGPNAGSRLQ